MLERVMIAGAGGQGVILIGKLLAALGVEKVPNLTFFPAYGAEVRGGTSNCQVVFSSEEIASPVSDEFETMILLNQASADRFKEHAGPDTLIVINSSMCADLPGPSCVAVPATDIADELGDVRIANFVMLGAYLACKPLASTEEVEALIRSTLSTKSPKLVELNLKALHEGMRRATEVNDAPSQRTG